MHVRKWLLLIVFGFLAAPAFAQLRATTVVTGLTNPVAFVQDPSDPAIQYIVEQAGRVRVLRNGTLQSTDFLNLVGLVLSGGEQGLLGIAFPANYGTSRRFYVNFTSPAGDIVVARFLRSATNPLVADPASRLDLQWSTGERFIRHPFTNHNGGNLVF